MTRVDADRLLAVALLGFAIARLAPMSSGRVREDVLEGVARALIVDQVADKCFVLPDTLRYEIAVKPPIRVCQGSGNEIFRERSGRILSIAVRTRYEKQEGAERAADSILALLTPILGTPRPCRGPFAWKWLAPKYYASIGIEPSSDVVRPDNQWRASFYVERRNGGTRCDA
jgi:hypothetical protein